MANLSYPTGTAGGFSVGASCDVPMSKARGEQFALIVARVQQDAQDRLQHVLERAGYSPYGAGELTVRSTDSYDFTWNDDGDDDGDDEND